MALSGEQVAQIAYEAGFRGADLVNMVAIAKRESGWTPEAHRTDRDPSALSGDMGLFQINYSNWGVVSSALGLTSKQQLFDPLVNAKAAKVLFDRQGLAPWTMGSNGWAAGGDPFKGTNRGEAQQVVSNAQSQGLLGESFAGYSGGPGGGPGGTAGDGPTSLPKDAQVFKIDGGWVMAVFSPAPGVNIQYMVPPDNTVSVDWNSVHNVTSAQYHTMFPPDTMVDGGMANELGTTTLQFGTFGKMWDSIVGQTMGYNNPAKDDPGVLKVLAEFAARPDMEPAELQNRLQATQWFQQHTQDQLEWNGLSEQEKRKRLDETATRMQSTIFQFVGVDVDRNDPRVKNHLEAVASGKTGFGAWTQIIKDQAADIKESPWARQVRDEQEAQRQRPIDIENTAQRIRETTERWGVGWSSKTIQKWAKDMVEKKSSDEDLVMELRKQAQVLYPWKDPEVETATAAAPWLETYQRVMEGPASISTPEVQKALTAGQAVFDFETDLKKSDKWLETKNGQDTMYSTVSELGARMGFV